MAEITKQTSVIDSSCRTSNFKYSEDHAMKLVLLNGLRRKPELCDEVLLKNLLNAKAFQADEHDEITKLLDKIRANMTVFTVNDLHNILKVPKLARPPETPPALSKVASNQTIQSSTPFTAPNTESVVGVPKNLIDSNGRLSVPSHFILPNISHLKMDSSFMSQNGVPEEEPLPTHSELVQSKQVQPSHRYIPDIAC